MSLSTTTSDLSAISAGRGGGRVVRGGGRSTRPRRGLAAALLACALAVVAVAPAPAAHAAADVGERGPAYSGPTHPPTSDKAQSKLWWNDGSWWADMWTTGAGWSIWRLDRAAGTWVDTGVVNDTRPDALGDTLWDGTHLYVASSVSTVSTQSKPNPSRPAPSYLYRYSYADGTYRLDEGFPSTINGVSSETLTIDQDTTGALWATWVEISSSGARPTATVRVASSGPGGTSWGDPFDVPVGDATPTVDDISSLVAVGGQIGVMWSDEAAGTVSWATHRDGAASSDAAAWTLKTALSGRNQADDHLNLKSLQADQSGAVFAVAKTSLDLSAGGGAAQVVLLSLAPGGTDFAVTPVSTVADCQTRPQVVVDVAAGLLRVYSAGPPPSVTGCPYSGSAGAIYEKTASLRSPSFAPGRGTPVIVDGSSAKVNDVTTSKAPATAGSGVVVLASNHTTKRYWSADLGPAVVAPPPSPAGAVSAGASTSAVSTTDTSTVAVSTPAGLADGDVLIAQITTDGAPSLTNVPAGWSQLVSDPLAPGGRVKTFVYGRVVPSAAAEPASSTWTLSAAESWNGGVSAFRGVDTTDPLDSAVVTGVAATSTSAIGTTGPTTTTPGAMLVGGVGVNSRSTSTAPPTGWTEAWEGVGGQSGAFSYQPRPVAGATGTLSWRLSASGTGGAWALALRPATP